ncbi:MAG: fasciclin domain-containing protein [Prevotella sp.]|nr:fasciclin domain-containing protein [Prevotella sp.]
MNTKSIKQFLLAGCVCCCATAVLTACSDWNDHYEGIADAAEGATLWQQMKANPQLSDFCEVLEQTKVYRMHKKTPVSYADLLNSGQTFTVMAPVNNSFDKNSLLQQVQTAVGDSAVEKSFVQNHITRQLVSSTPDAAKMLMLNLKHLTMANGMIDDIHLTAPNTKSSNGVLHVIERALPYKHNILEMLCDNTALENIGANIRRFNEDIFDPATSVSNGVVDGVPVYVDSVVYERNRLLEYVGLLDAEDSTYLVVVPTTEGWNEIYNETAQYFLYDKSIEKRDSLQQFYTMHALLEDAVFNMTDQKSINDSLISVPYIYTPQSFEKGKKVYHVFQKPFEEGGILYGAEKLPCSNGWVYTTPKWSFKPTDTFFKELRTEGESTWMITQERDCSYNARRQIADSISSDSYLQIIPRTGTSNWQLTFRLNNTLAGDYDICAVILPQSVAGLSSEKPCKFKATISYVDEDNNTQTFNCNNTQFQSNPERVDTVVLAEAFHFPTCNFDQNEVKVTLRLECSILARETSRFSREMYLDCIYLRPRTSKSDEQ